FAGGKRFRPTLCLAVAEVLGCPSKKVLPFACAVEMIHTFTLIHDDLPPMDNSDLRRGKTTCHKEYGEALAILAGDGLNTLAFKIIANYPKALSELASALMVVVEGQVADIQSTKKKMSIKELVEVHNWKTGALLIACVRGTALICGASPKKVEALTNYAHHLGLAFQIADDILDSTSTSEQLGKPAGADIGKGFPFVVGLDKSKELAAEEMAKAIKAVSIFGKKSSSLISLAEYVLSRKK
ncbi:MAG: polyprenyl synthetase family protein, partial [bacterium]